MYFMNRRHFAHLLMGLPLADTRDIAERSGVAAFMSANSKTPYITPSMEFSSGKGVLWGVQGAAAGIYLADSGVKLASNSSSMLPMLAYKYTMWRKHLYPESRRGLATASKVLGPKHISNLDVAPF